MIPRLSIPLYDQYTVDPSTFPSDRERDTAFYNLDTLCTWRPVVGWRGSGVSGSLMAYILYFEDTLACFVASMWLDFSSADEELGALNVWLGRAIVSAVMDF
jgi:hypothetical protein